jgi:outer membrane lipoprotein carrier protein
MRKKLLTIISAITIALTLHAQNDNEAISVLDKFSATATSAPSVSMNFLLVTLDQVENYTDTISGSVILSGNRYKLDLPDNIIWFNGKTSWSYLPAEKEVTIIEPDKDDDSFQSRPSSIFTVYKNGYKCRLLEETASSYLIDLYPNDTKNELIRMRLNIRKPSLDLNSFEYKRRDGITLTLIVKKYSLTKVPETGMFNFQPSKYKGVEVIDMR